MIGFLIVWIAIAALGGILALYVTGASLVSLAAKKPRTVRDAEALHHTNASTRATGPIASQSSPRMKRKLTLSISLLVVGLLLAILRSVVFILALLVDSLPLPVVVLCDLSSKVMLYSTMVILKRQFFPWSPTSARRKCLSVIGDSGLICIASGLALTILSMVSAL